MRGSWICAAQACSSGPASRNTWRRNSSTVPTSTHSPPELWNGSGRPRARLRPVSQRSMRVKFSSIVMFDINVTECRTFHARSHSSVLHDWCSSVLTRRDRPLSTRSNHYPKTPKMEAMMTATSIMIKQICMRRFLIKGGPSDRSMMRGMRVHEGVCISSPNKDSLYPCNVYPFQLSIPGRQRSARTCAARA
jgi:hypothetical protein